MTTFLVSLLLLASVLIRWSATETYNSDDSSMIETQWENDDEQQLGQLFDEKLKNEEELVDDDYVPLLEYLDSLRREDRRQDIISHLSDLPGETEKWKRQSEHCCRYACRCCPYKCRWICPLCSSLNSATAP